MKTKQTIDAAKASALLKTIHDQLGDEAFIKLCIQACLEDLNDEDDPPEDRISRSDLTPSDIVEWCNGLKESILDVMFS